jgi:uncharacterized protein (DUF362 family)
MLLSPLISPISAFARPGSISLATVGIIDTTNTTADAYDPAGVKAKVQALFDAIGGISDVIRTDSKVAIKINLVGGSGSAMSSALKGVPITEAMWTHPVVMRAVAELLIDAGVSANNITIVEALWDTGATAPFGASDSLGYTAAKNAVGCNFINLSAAAPYGDLADVPTGSPFHNFASFKMNRILTEVDAYISIPKLKHHYENGFSGSLKNQVGTVPVPYYALPSNTGNRSALHSSDGGASTMYLPRSVCDLNRARPVHLAVIDGIRNATGGEGVWNPTFAPARRHALIGGKDPVATDSIGALLMGLDPEATTLPLPKGGGATCDNHLALLHARGAGTNQRAEITLTGDGTHLVTAVDERASATPRDKFRLLPNFPNPFNPATRITYFCPREARASLAIYSVTGAVIQTLVDGAQEAGEHQVVWTPEGLTSGTYFCRLQVRPSDSVLGRDSRDGAEGFSETIKLLYVR